MRAIVPAPMMLTLLMVYLLPVASLQSLVMPASDSPGLSKSHPVSVIAVT